MGVDTKAILVSHPNHEEVAQAIKEIFGFDPEVRIGYHGPDGEPDYFTLVFPDPGDTSKVRQLSVFLKTSDDRDVFDGPATHLMLSAWGQSVEICEALARKFGGFVCDNDSMDDWRVVDRVVDAGAVVAPLTPAAELNMSLSKILPAAQALEIRKLTADPATLLQVMAVFDDYRARLDADTVAN